MTSAPGLHLSAMPPPPGRTGNWKLHLNVAPEHRDAIEGTLRATGVLFKRGRSSGQAGKDFTIYTGSMDDTVATVGWLEAQPDVVCRLGPVTGEALLNDAPIGTTGTIAARFDAGHAEDDFSQYGLGGVPDFKLTTMRLHFGPQPSVEERNAALVTAYDELERRYGTYFTGSGNEASEVRRSLASLGSTSYEQARGIVEDGPEQSSGPAGGVGL